MSNYWSQLCTAQSTRPLPQLRQALYGSGIFAVSAVVALCRGARVRCVCCCNTAHALGWQVASFGFAAVFSGTWFALWVRLWVRMRREGFLGPLVEPEARRRRDGGMWVQLGWFSGLVCAGSVAGAIAWDAFMPATAFEYFYNVTDVTAQQEYALAASSNRWLSVFSIFYPVEYLCMIMAKVLLLGRLSNHASRNYNSQAWHMDDGAGACDCIGEYALEKLHRAISKAVALASVAGVLAMVVSAVYVVKAAGVNDQAAAACDAQGNYTIPSIALDLEAQNFFSIAADGFAVEAVLEAIVLVVMSAAYTVFIPVCVSMFGRTERRLIRILGQIEYKLDHSIVFLPAEYNPEYNPQAAHGTAADAEIHMRCDTAKELLRATLAEATAQRRRFVAACAIVLLTFFLRASFQVLNAFSYFDFSYNLLCGQCEPCQSDRFLIFTWLIYTPEFRTIIVSLSSPLPLVVSLWLMMTKEDRMLLLFPAAHEHAHPLLEQNMVVASRRNMSIDLL